MALSMRNKMDVDPLPSESSLQTRKGTSGRVGKRYKAATYKTRGSKDTGLLIREVCFESAMLSAI